MIFTPFSAAREHLPIIHADAVGRGIEIRDQVGIMRLLPGDRVTLVEDRGDYTLCRHAACTLGLLLIARTNLRAEEGDLS